ncbi:hypothetical protein CL689_02390 [Candidatus Saccharibacteria bacterium]|nr:hypothetical protein [Candidatus Saccharibacteria bacterium]|tara:strand:- start:821 stop:1147 length:327 start_codon:yes stop_codon:yes gene_type:complete
MRQIRNVSSPDLLEYEFQISLSRDAVWVHASDGSTVGRFGKMGIDIHSTVAEQMNGASQCDLCTHGRVTSEDWATFRKEALARWGIEIPDDAFDPRFFSAPNSPLRSF